jgi:hypothetical protein
MAAITSGGINPLFLKKTDVNKVALGAGSTNNAGRVFSATIINTDPQIIN